MGLFSKHNEKIRRRFITIFEEGKNESESDFLDSINIIVRMVELDKNYSTNDKLRIYELLSQLCNCAAVDRPRYAAKLKRTL